MSKEVETPIAENVLKTVKDLSDKQPSKTNIVIIGRNSALDDVKDLDKISGVLKRISFDEYNQSKKDQKFYGAYVGFVETEDGSMKKAQLDPNDVVAIGANVTIRKHIREEAGKTYHSYSLA
jgi:hypothetical protein